jgi:transcriptional regulator with XRE-family HTH domain
VLRLVRRQMIDSPSSPRSSQTSTDVMVGSRIEQALISAGISKGDLCRELSVSTDQLHAWCSGSERISIMVLCDIAELTGTEVQWFFGY